MTRAWPRLAAFLVLAMAALAAAAVIIDIEAPVRPIATLSFALFGPGLLVMRMVRLPSIPMELALAVPVSLAVDALIAGAILYLGLWSSDLVLVLVIAVSVALAARQLLRSAGFSERGA